MAGGRLRVVGWRTAKTLASALAFLAVFGTLSPPMPSTYDQEVLPARAQLFTGPPPSLNVTVVSVDDLDPSWRLTAASLQGIVNRRQARMYLEDDDSGGLDAALLDVLHRRHGVTWAATTLFSALRSFVPEVSGLVIYDPARPESVNVATTLAGLRNGLVVTPDQARSLQRTYALTIIEDLRTPPWQGLRGADLSRAAIARLLPIANRTMLGYLRPDRIGPRDFLMAAKAFVFYADVGPFADAEQLSIFDEVMDATPANVAVIGWMRSPTGTEENLLVQKTSRAGKFLVGAEGVPNLSLLSAFGRGVSRLERQSPQRIPLEDRIYVSFAVTDGDNLDYVRLRLWELWGQPERGTLPIAWSIAPALADLAPAYLDLLFEQATANDTFLAGPSGAGYAYPSFLPQAMLSVFLEESRDAMRRADLRIAWLLNAYTPYETPYPDEILRAYDTAVRPDGLLLDYGDRPIGNGCRMAGLTPVARSLHLWGSVDNLREKVRLDVETIGGPHFLVVAIHPQSYELADVREAAEALRSLAPERTSFVWIEELFDLMLRQFPRWADAVAAELHNDDMAVWLYGGRIAEADAAREASHRADSLGDRRTAASAAFHAIRLYREASAASSILLLVLAGSLVLMAILWTLKEFIQLHRKRTKSMLAWIVVTLAAAFLASGTRAVLTADFWGYAAVVVAILALGPAILAVHAANRWETVHVAAPPALMVVGATLLVWSPLGLVPMTIGGALLLHAGRSGGCIGWLWVTALGAGLAVGFLAPWNPVLAFPLAVLVAASLRMPREDMPRTLPARRALMGSVGLALLSAIPLFALIIPWTPFGSLRTSWEMEYAFLGIVGILGLAPALGAASAQALRVPWRLATAGSVALFIAASFASGILMISLLFAGISAAVGAFVVAEPRLKDLARLPELGAATAGLTIVLIALARVQPGYYSVNLGHLPAFVEYILYHPPLVAALTTAAASLLLACAVRRTGLGPASPDETYIRPA